MKKTVLTLIGLAMILQLAQCSSSSSSTKTAVKSDPVVESCKKNCTAVYGKCIQAAGNSESKKSACTSSMVKCSGKCDTKAKDYKKPESGTKYQKSPEI